MGMAKWWSKSRPRRNEKDGKSSKNPTEGSNKGKFVRNPSEAKPGTSRAKEAERIVDSLQNLEVILKDANIGRQDFSPFKLLNRLQGGVLLNQKRQKYWVDKLGKNCYMIYARDFNIIWGYDNRYWCWSLPEETSGNEAVEMAEMIKVSWLDVSGSFDLEKLSLETLYEASFVVMMKDLEVILWDTPVNSVRIQPDGRKRRGLSFVVMMENEVVWDTPVKEIPTVRLMTKNEDGTVSPLSFLPTQLDGSGHELVFAVTTKNEAGWCTPATFVPSQQDGSRHDLSFAVKTENKVVWDTPVKEVPTVLVKVISEDGTVSPVVFGPSQLDGGRHELVFAVMMKTEVGRCTPLTFIPNQPDGRRQELSLSFVVRTENEVAWDTPVKEEPTALVLMMKNEDGTISPVSFVPAQPDGSMHELLFAIAMKNEAGLYSPVAFIPTQPDGSRHELSFAVMMKNEVGVYTPVTFIPSQPDGSRHELSFAVMMKNEVVWQSPVTVVPTLLDGSTHELLFVVKMKNEVGLDTLVTFIPTQPDGSRHRYSFAVAMKNEIGWESPVTIKLTQPHGSKQEHKVMMSNLPKDQWVEIPLGKFRTFPQSVGKLKFFMSEHKNQLWKRGLIIKGFKIQAKIT